MLIKAIPIIIDIHDTGIGVIVEARHSDNDAPIFEQVFDTLWRAEHFIEVLEKHGRYDVLKVIDHD